MHTWLRISMLPLLAASSVALAAPDYLTRLKPRAVLLPKLLEKSPSSCLFSGEDVLAPLRAAGKDGTLARKRAVTVKRYQKYATPYNVDVAVWVDDAFLKKTPKAAALALSYFEHANCMYALGKSKLTKDGVNLMSMTLAGSRINYFKAPTPPIKDDAVWIQQFHWDWYKWMKRYPAGAKMNVMITPRSFVDIVHPSATKDQYHFEDAKGNKWLYVGGASNGVGQGQAIVGVDPNWLSNGAVVGGIKRPYAEDWWGVIFAHETGHALGRGGHEEKHYSIMCCSGPDYTWEERGTEPAKSFALSSESWAMIYARNANPVDEYPDPYAKTPNPVTNEKWDYKQTYQFLAPGAAPLPQIGRLRPKLGGVKLRKVPNGEAIEVVYDCTDFQILEPQVMRGSEVWMRVKITTHNNLKKAWLIGKTGYIAAKYILTGVTCAQPLQ